jgi:type VI secretion system Hcp family effector
MSAKVFLRLDGIPGECADQQHREWIEAVSFRLAASVATPPEGLAGAARAQVEELRIGKAVDAASPRLLEACLAGRHIKEAVVEVMRLPTRIKYLEYRFSDVFVVAVGLDIGGDEAVSTELEQVRLSFGKVRMTYHHKTATGALAQTGFGWDLAAREPLQ